MTRFNRNLFVIIILSLSISIVCSNTCNAQGSSAQKLTTVVPDDVLGFMATSGGDELKPAFEKTILNQIWKDPGVQNFYQAIRKELMTKIQQESNDPNEKMAVDTVLNFAGLIKNRPFIVGMAQKQAKEGPPFYGFAILDAGNRKAEIAAALTKLEAIAGEGDIADVKIGSATLHGPKDNDDFPGYWGWIGNYLVFAIHDDEGLAIKYLQGSAMSRPMPNYLQKVPANNDALAVYINPEKALQLVGNIATMEGGEKEFAKVKAVINELGIDKIKTITSRIGFEGSNLVVNELVEMPEPRTGIFANIKTIDMKMFDMVDARAMSAAAFNCDIAGIYDTVMNAIKAAAGEDFAEVQQGIAELERQLQFKIRDGLLASLNGQTVFYVLPGGVMAQSPQGGFVVIAGLKDAKLWEQTLAALGKFAAEKSNGMVQISSQMQNDKTIHTWAVMPLAMAQIMPCWVISGDKVVIASNPAMCNLAIEQMGPGKNSIRSTAGFKNATVNLPENLLSVQYNDSKVQFNQTMMSVQQFWPMLTMAATNAGLKLPFMLPSLTHIAEKMEPSIQCSWYDAQGLRSHYRGAGVEQSIGAVAGAAVGLGVMMPALARTRQQAYRMVSATNLKGIGKAMLIYANDYDDEFPPNLEILVEKCELPAQVLESKRKPKGFTGPSYIYITGQNVSMQPGNITVYENPAYCTDGINVLFLDCHVQWMKPEDFMKELKETYQRLGREMPEIKFKK
jgi:prepilin-type processing-associated H-X9-DG protein